LLDLSGGPEMSMELMFVLYPCESGWQWHLAYPDGTIVAQSPAAFPTEEDCRDAIEVVKAALRSPVLVRSQAPK